MKPAVRQSINRRDFIVSATAAAGLCVLNCDALAQQVAPAIMVKALDDPDVIHETVTFRNGSGEIDGYLSRPRKPGRHRDHGFLFRWPVRADVRRSFKRDKSSGAVLRESAHARFRKSQAGSARCLESNSSSDPGTLLRQ